MRAIIVVALLILAPANAHAFELPALAEKLERHTVRAVQQVHGLNGPVALHGAIVHQESRWRPDAESPVGAQGLAQFMPATAGDMPQIMGVDEFDPFDPRQSINAMSAYTGWLAKRAQTRGATSECSKWAFILSAYNGGLGWTGRDRALAEAAGDDPGRWWCSVENYSDRSDAAFKENRDYVDVILLRWQIKYLHAGWRGPRIC